MPESAPTLTRLPSLAGALLLGIVLVFNLEASGTPNIWIYSYFKGTLLALLAVLTVYCLVAQRSAKLRRINNLALYGLVFNLVLVELAFRCFPGLVPADLIAMLPTAPRRDLAARHGLFTQDTFQGGGMLYAFRPDNQALNTFPWVRLDGDGFRNPAVPKGPVDTVIFGDSVTFARHAREDIAQRLSKRGTPSYSLAMGGNSPYQFRDAYKRYVLGRGLVHRRLLVFVSPANDFVESLRYVQVAGRGGDYRDYLGQAGTIGPAWADRQPFWTVAIIAHLPAYLRTNLTGLATSLNRASGQVARVKLGYADYPVTPQFLDFPAVEETGAAWHAFAAGLNGLVALADGAGAEVNLVILPSPSLLYRNYVTGFERHKHILERRYRNLLTLIERQYGGRARIIDLAEPLARAIGTRPLSAARLDYHFNDEGWALIADELVRRMAPSRANPER